MRAAFKHNDMSCLQRLIDHGLAAYGDVLDCAVMYNFGEALRLALARPFPCADLCGVHNSVLDWLLAYPPRHVVQAILVMCGETSFHPRLRPLCVLCDKYSRDCSRSCYRLSLVAANGHPASLQKISELRSMVDILADDASGTVIPEARQPLSSALRVARGVASI